MPIETAISNGHLGWTIRKIRSVSPDGCVTLNDGVSFCSYCFRGAKAGDIWAVKHEHYKGFAFGSIETAYLLERGE